MKTKYFISIAVAMLFALAGFAQGGELVSVRIVYSGVKTSKLFIYQNGTVTQTEIPTNHEDEIKFLLELLEKYTKQGYKLVTSTYAPAGIYSKEYILQKD